MKARILLMVALILALVGTLSVGSAAAGDAVVPFKATIQTFPQPQGVEDNCLVVKIPGQGQATHLGGTVFDSDMWACFDGSQYGTMILTAANGDQLFGGFRGTWSGDPTVFVSFQGTFWITEDGTGRFEGATATGTYGGTAEAGEGILYFNGVLTK
ncbi:MAG: hypothetical protein PVI59_02665 [Anaerolineae bacterium]